MRLTVAFDARGDELRQPSRGKMEFKPKSLRKLNALNSGRQGTGQR
jgi:hypothetical protein